MDVLFIDEAGQMSLADTIAAALCATNLVLLGDPQQLDQPLQGTHPPGAERSALAHVLDGKQVMPDHLGLFLNGTWRLHPSISAYTSEVFKVSVRVSRRARLVKTSATRSAPAAPTTHPWSPGPSPRPSVPRPAPGSAISGD